MIAAHGVFREKGAGRCESIQPEQQLDPMLLDALVEFAPDGMMITNENQEIIAFNSSFLEALGSGRQHGLVGNARSAALRIIRDQDGFLSRIEALYADRENSATGAPPHR
ncbi:MAG: hypothetical protein R2849_06230 [Thermomicrobiales bacterium]